MRRSSIVAVCLVALVLAGLGASAWIEFQMDGPDITGVGAFSGGVAFFTFVGAMLVWRQPGNRIGWLFSAIGILWVTGDAASRYSTYAFETGETNLTLIRLGAWYGEWYWFLFLMLTFSLLPQLFPTGTPMPGPWRPIARAVLIFSLSMAGLAMFEDQLDLVQAGVIDNPIGIPGLHDIEQAPVAFVLLPGGLLSVIAGMVAIVLRFRRARGDERQQLKWFTVAVVTLVVQFALQSFITDDGEGHTLPWLTGIALALVPISAAVAIFRYRLYDIDLVINRALVYAVLSAILGGVYLGIVVLLQGALATFTAESDVAIAGSTLAVAALFRPVRGRVQEFIDRRFYRHKYDAAETLEEFSASLRDEVDLDALSRELVDVVASTMQPVHASLWLRSEGTA